MTRLEGRRKTGLSRLAQFIADGKDRSYSDHRKYDLGPGNHLHVSVLSPYTRYRLITEAEIASRSIASSGTQTNEKFLHEVLWRTYWKGYLERRPSIWTSYQKQLTHDLPVELKRQLEAAIIGQTGIDCFDAWIIELKEKGYLHNHARMWFASIWIYTLRLPWYLGAQLFLDYLIDGDPAVNTLSWRWVAGLHTKGKQYLASRDNIARFTKGRFNPVGIAETAFTIEEPEVHPLMPHVPISTIPSASKYTALIIFPDDLTTDLEFIELNQICSEIIIFNPNDEGQKLPDQFRQEAISDTAARLEMDRSMPVRMISSLKKLQQEQGSFIGYSPPVGPCKDQLKMLSNASSIEWLRRPWDEMLWPAATAGFFKFIKAGLPSIRHLIGDNTT